MEKMFSGPEEAFRDLNKNKKDLLDFESFKSSMQESYNISDEKS
jgi:hypothetical protein